MHRDTEKSIEASRMGEFRRWLSQYSGRDFQSYGELWQWSVTNLDDFWPAIWDFFDVAPRAYESPVLRGQMPGAEWFSGEMLNYADVALRTSGDDPAVIARSEARPDILLSGIELRSHVENAAAGLRSLGVGPETEWRAYLRIFLKRWLLFLPQLRWERFGQYVHRN
jgi:acetoacetyl-CoA synthetase